ncbi:MAG TPA: hypothetical protein VJR89_17130 [Polyangiales bacterium]|nr:hypothetical protein [Polyangiales bacterium]
MSRTVRFWLACALLFAVLCALYLPGLRASPSSLDDVRTLQELAHAPLTRVWQLDRFGHLRPLKSALFFAIARSEAALPLYRAAIFGVFLATVALLQAFAGRLLSDRRWGLATAATWSLNPAIASVVCWLSAASYVLCAFGALCYLQLAAAARLSRGRYLAAHLGLVIAVLGCELGLLTPLLLFASSREARDRARLLGAAACIGVWVALYAVSPASPVGYRLAAEPGWMWTLHLARAAFENLQLWAWLPSAFGVLRTDAPSEHVPAMVVSWVAALGVGLLVFRARRDRVLVFAALTCIVWLVPVIDLIPLGTTPIAMHYVYLPSIGLALALSALGLRVPRVAPALALVWLAWLPATWQARTAWADDVALYARTLESFPENLEVRVNLSALELANANYARAQEVLDAGLRVAPQQPALVRHQLEVLLATGQAERALAWFELHPELVETTADALRLGELQTGAGRADVALESVRRAQRLAASDAERRAAGYALIAALLRAGQAAEARGLVQQLLREHPDDERLLLAQRVLSYE